jgi:hypothetical protein
MLPSDASRATKIAIGRGDCLDASEILRAIGRGHPYRESPPLVTQ